MPDVKISALPAASTPLSGTEVLPIVQSATTRQVSVANLTAGRAISASSITASSLTSGRVTFAGASGLLSDSANLTFDGTNLTTGGSETAARFIPSGSTVATNGMFLPAANTLGFSTNSSERMRITSGGTITLSATSNGSADIQVINNTNGLRLVGGTTIGTDSEILLGGSASGTGSNIYFDGADKIFRTAGGSNQAVITSAGLVGIGTSSPAYTLAVNGTGVQIIGSGTASLYLADGTFQTSITSASNTIRFNGDTGTERMRIDSSGNLLLSGTVAATTTGGMTITNTSSGSSSTPLALRNAGTANGSGVQISFRGVTNASAENDYAYFNMVADDTTAKTGSMRFSTANGSSPVERMRIDSSGNVGIGTSSPAANLHVVNTAYVKGSASTDGDKGITISSGSGAVNTSSHAIRTGGGTGNLLIIETETANSSGQIVFQTNNAERMRIDSSGIVTMSAYGAGAATFSASGVISSVSDETWKVKDGTPVNTDAMLQKLEPGYWFYNEEKAPTFGEERQLGFYAQNVHEAIGEEAAPTPQEGKPWGYHDRSVLAIAVMSLKNALNTIEELKQRIETLENK
jgi:hypothetical protein